jgi:23S rRNA (uracil1939-C5)-methyltransferase
VLAGEVEGAWVPSDAEVCRRWLDGHRDCAGLKLRGRGWRMDWGDSEVAVGPEEGLSLTIDGGGFSQVNPTANRILVDTVLEMAGDVLGKAVLDAYAGAGNFSAPLARRGAAVTAIEQAADACRSAERNSAECAASWRTERGRVDRVLGRLARSGERFDLLLLDPPRSGANESIAHVLEIRPETVVYVSCDPATLARDLAALHPTYRVERVQPVDMFPHTYHVETVTRCRRA